MSEQPGAAPQQPLQVQSAVAMATVAQRAQTQLYLDTQAKKKRGPPTPVASSSATPQEPQAPITAKGWGDASSSDFVNPVFLEDHTSLQVTAADMGYNINDQKQMDEFLNKPVHTARDVMNLVRSYHKAVIRPEMMGMVKQLEHSIKAVNDRVFNCARELQFMVSENRSSQKHA